MQIENNNYKKRKAGERRAWICIALFVQEGAEHWYAVVMLLAPGEEQGFTFAQIWNGLDNRLETGRSTVKRLGWWLLER